MAEFQVLMTHDFDPTVRGHRKRKPIRRTKSGCMTCKSKKAKCDEPRPICTRCKRNGWGCVYGGDDTHGSHSTSLRSPMSTKECFGSFSILSCLTVALYTLRSTRDGTPSMHLIRHCCENWTEIFNMNQTTQFLYLFQSNSLIRNSLLAITASHLRHVAQGDIHHRISENFQQSLAIQDYLKTTSTPLKDLGQSGVNILLLGTTLPSILAFPLPASESIGCDEPYSSTSWGLAKNSDRLRWLAFQAGVRPLMRSMEPYLEGAMGFLGPIFLDPNEGRWPTTSHGLEIVPKKWIKFFEVEGLKYSYDNRLKDAPCVPSDGV